MYLYYSYCLGIATRGLAPTLLTITVYGVFVRVCVYVCMRVCVCVCACVFWVCLGIDNGKSD